MSGDFPPYVCRNPSCKSYGKSHPNCRCGPEYAHGGMVCSGGHHEDCEHFADGGTIEANMKFHGDPENALDHVGAHHGVLGLLTKTGHSKSDNPNKHFQDYRDHYLKGQKKVNQSLTSLFTKDQMHASKEEREDLKKHIDSLQENPESLLDVGGSLDMPEHRAVLAAKAATAFSYLSGLKPKANQSSPLENPAPPDKAAEIKYNRNLDLAQNPGLILHHIKSGTLMPDDITTVSTIFPKLTAVLKERVFEQIVDAKKNGKEIPFRQKQSLSMFLGMPLDSSMSPASMQAIIKSAGPQQMNNKSKAQPERPQRNSKASGAELNQINKINKLDTTDLQDRAFDKRK